MYLEYKPDFAEARVAWQHYWAKEAWQRPLVVAEAATAPLAWEDNPYCLRYARAMRGEYGEILTRIDRWLASRRFLAESIPFYPPDHGPDQFAAFLGAPLIDDADSPETNWVEPIVTDWETALPLRLNEQSPTWQSTLAFSRALAEHARGRYVVGTCDLHSNADALSALRSPQQLCLDFYDTPELVARAMREVRALYQPIYNRIYEASGNTRETGSCGWAPFWCEGKFATIQCDFICLVSPEIAREYIIPALAEEAAFLDHCVYHYDGPGALPHLDDILAIPEIDVIQWVSGDGQPPMWQWLDVLQRCQRAGKGLQISGLTIDEAKVLNSELDPAGLVYCIGGESAENIEAFTRWLERAM
jgi:hypothetical protein